MELRDADGNEMSFQHGRVSIRGGGALNISAQKVEINAGRVDVAAGIAKFTGRVECDTLKANAVIAQSDTPGAGNVW